MRKLLPLLFCLFGTLSVSADVNIDEILERFGETLDFPNLQGSIKVEMISHKGDVREIEARVYQKAIDSEQLNILFQLEYPPTVRDTGILLHTFFNGDDSNMWIYLPAVKRIKRVSLEQSGGGYFMGSDFTYSDFVLRTKEDYEREYLGEQEVDGRLCYTIKDWAKSIEEKQTRGYAFTVNYFSTQDYFLYARDYYDLSGQLLKTYRVKSVFNIDGRIYPTRIVMHNVQTDHKSILDFKDYTMEEIPDQFFTTRYLKSR